MTVSSSRGISESATTAPISSTVNVPSAQTSRVAISPGKFDPKGRSRLGTIIYISEGVTAKDSALKEIRPDAETLYAAITL